MKSGQKIKEKTWTGRILFQKFFYSRFLIIIFFTLSFYLLYLNYQNISFMLEMRRRLVMAEDKYEKAVSQKRKDISKVEDASTEESKERYAKEFFNKTEEGETVVLLHRDAQFKIKENEEEILRLNFIDRIIQKVNLWWKNL